MNNFKRVGLNSKKNSPPAFLKSRILQSIKKIESSIATKNQ